MGQNMDLVHGTWVPGTLAQFENPGKLVVWLEATGGGREAQSGIRAAHLAKQNTVDHLLPTDPELSKLFLPFLDSAPAKFCAFLPSSDGRPLPSLELAQLEGEFLPDDYEWQAWTLYGICIRRPLQFLRDMRLYANYSQASVKIAVELKFWMRYAQHLSNLIRQHQFLPYLKCHLPGRSKSRLKIHSGWQPAGDLYESQLNDFAALMPRICTAVSGSKHGKQNDSSDETDILRNFSEQQVDEMVANTALPAQTLNRMKGCWLASSLQVKDREYGLRPADAPEPDLEHWQQWRSWQREISGRAASDQESRFVLGIRLDESDDSERQKWRLSFFVASSEDPSLKIDLEEWWLLSQARQAGWLKTFGAQFERNLLVSLGHAARVCPLLWEGLESEQPSGIAIDLDTAYRFLKDDALVLESAGFRILVPSWWMPKGRLRARIRIKASGQSRSSSSAESSGYLSLPSLVQYDYELSVGGEPISELEWQDLVSAKAPLIRFRGEWMELDRDHMAQLLDLWRSQQPNDAPLSFKEMLKQVSEADEDATEFMFDEVLRKTLKALQRQEDVEPIEDPGGLQGSLRPYQQQGLSWLATQEALGLCPCLADDMGLGKTIQIIALLLHERECAEHRDQGGPKPTLLIAPTSVLSNWRKEVERFAPRLRCLIHHGSQRHRDLKALKLASSDVDLVITSFAVATRDRELIKEIGWGRVVVDEAQNIKNPRTAQAKAIFALNAPLRIALTGTPVENRLTDLWSLFNFLNPGYLGTAAQFKRAYETPIQRGGDKRRLMQLQQLVRPFILRRLKTDKSIIADLPNKLEQKVFCNLTREQASLYQAVVDEVERNIEQAEGMARRGLILSTLMKLKQICNHPAQFLQDGSSFSESRSHKLTRLVEMIQEALAESDSMLVFTQFTAVAGELEKLLRSKCGCPVYYLHGGTSRKRRERMIESFQDPETPEGIFILSLRAGGVGITLTQANHVFHFDRWWNPAVENQATDRAYRIGQEKTVFAHKMVTFGTFEERIDQLIDDKKALAESIVGTDEAWLTELDDAAFKQLIELNRESIMES